MKEVSVGIVSVGFIDALSTESMADISEINVDIVDRDSVWIPTTFFCILRIV